MFKLIVTNHTTGETAVMSVPAATEAAARSFAADAVIPSGEHTVLLVRVVAAL